MQVNGTEIPNTGFARVELGRKELRGFVRKVRTSEQPYVRPMYLHSSHTQRICIQIPAALRSREASVVCSATDIPLPLLLRQCRVTALSVIRRDSNGDKGQGVGTRSFMYVGQRTLISRTEIVLANGKIRMKEE